MAVEVKIKMGATFASKPADIVVHADNSKQAPRIIVEFKKPNRLDGLDQLHSYMNATGVHFGAWVNGLTRANQLRQRPNSFESVKTLPAMRQTVDDVKSPITKAQLVPLQDLKDEIANIYRSLQSVRGPRVPTFATSLHERVNSERPLWYCRALRNRASQCA